MLKVIKKEHHYKTINAKPTLLGFGTMRLPLKNDTTDVDMELSQKMFDYAYEHGINYFDTAYVYQNRIGEKIVGELLKKYPRENIYIATKMPSWDIKNVEDAKRIFKEQLDNLQTSYFDFYLCHSLNTNSFKIYKDPEIINFLFEAKKKGLIKHLGFSFHDTPEVLDEIIHTYPWDFVQIQLNYLDWNYQQASKQYEIITKMNLPVIVMEPVRGGGLANLCKEANKLYTDYHPDKSIASWALRYVASLSNVLTVLSGMSSFEQVKDNINTFCGFQPLTKEEYEIIDRALDIFLKNETIPCTGCRYCMDCPMGIDIPKVLYIYNEYKLTKNPYFLNFLSNLPEDKKPSKCIKCGKCMTRCPQHINIPSIIEKINGLIIKK